MIRRCKKCGEAFSYLKNGMITAQLIVMNDDVAVIEVECECGCRSLITCETKYHQTFLRGEDVEV